MVEARLLSIRTLIVAAVGLALAGASTLAAFDMVHAKHADTPILGGAMTPGPALSHRAMGLIAAHAEVADDGIMALPSDVAEQAEALSRDALRRTPMDAAALRNLALLEAGDENGARARALLLLAERLTRRDRRTNVLLAQDAALAGDLTGTVARLDHAMRTSSSARREILPLLYQALEQPGADAVIARMLGSGVNWEADFWANAASHGEALDQLAALRITRAEAGFASTVRDDRRLLAALVKAGKFASAEALSDMLHGEDRAPNNALRNGAFARLPQIGAFDWELRFDSGMTTDILPGAGKGRGQLRIRTYSDGGGLAARQLVALPAARYGLDLRTTEWDERDAQALSLRLRCAERSDAARRFAIAGRRQTISFAKPSPDCTFFWLDLVVTPQGDRRENTILIDSITLAALPEGAV